MCILREKNFTRNLNIFFPSVFEHSLNSLLCTIKFHVRNKVIRINLSVHWYAVRKLRDTFASAVSYPPS